MVLVCDEEELSRLIEAMQSPTSDALALADRMIGAYPDDGRLHFLRGSMLAASGRPIEAHASLSRAVALSPDFALARFQLGFFELTSGEAQRALATWEPLDQLGDEHYLHLFVQGLRALIEDRFADTVKTLRMGIAANSENAPLNVDMQRIIDACQGLAATGQSEVVELSATSLLLDQFNRGTTH